MTAIEYDINHRSSGCSAEECALGLDREPAANQSAGVDAEQRGRFEGRGRVEEPRTIGVEEALRLISSAESEARHRTTFRPITLRLSPEGRARISRDIASSAKCEHADVAQTKVEEVATSGAEWVKMFSS